MILYKDYGQESLFNKLWVLLGNVFDYFVTY